MKAKILNGKCVAYPYTMESLAKDNPNSSFDNRFDLEGWFVQTEDHLKEKAVLVDVTEENFPVFDHEFKKAVLKDSPVFVAGNWVLQYEIIDKNPEELTAQANYELGSSIYGDSSSV